MSIRGNSGFIDTDKRFGTTSGDTKGVVAREQHFLERTQGRFAPIGPLSPPDPTVWYDATDVELRPATSNVLTWFDQSGNGITASGNGSLNTPLYNATDATFGGYPSLQFDNTDFLESLDDALLDSTNGFTVYFVTSIISFPSTFSVLATFTNSTSWTQGWGLLYYSGNWRFFVNNWNSTSTRVDMGSWSDFTNPHIFKFHYDRTNIKGEIFGTSAVGETTKAYSTAVSNPNSEGIRLGDGNSSTYQIRAKIAEVLFYNSPLTNDEQLQAEAYLKDKFSIS
jgi:hypothetical protein